MHPKIPESELGLQVIRGTVAYRWVSEGRRFSGQAAVAVSNRDELQVQFLDVLGNAHLLAVIRGTDLIVAFLQEQCLAEVTRVDKKTRRVLGMAVDAHWFWNHIAHFSHFSRSGSRSKNIGIEPGIRLECFKDDAGNPKLLVFENSRQKWRFEIEWLNRSVTFMPMPDLKQVYRHYPACPKDMIRILGDR